MLCRTVGTALDTLPQNLLDKELGITPDPSTQHSADDDQALRSAGVAASGSDLAAAERLPLFSHKVMAFVQHLLQYKVRQTGSTGHNQR